MGRSDRIIRYDAFGLRLDSEFELPELEQSRSLAAADWRVAAGSAAKALSDELLLGTDFVYGSVRVCAYRSPSAMRLVFDDTGTFEIRRHDRTITWYRGPNATDETMRADLLGRVIAFAAHGDGDVALHASAVCIDGRAVALLGSRGAGKSTLAFALVKQGARLLTDDTLIVRFDDQGEPWAAPGLQRVRLWEDSARALGASAVGTDGAKSTLDLLPRDQRQDAGARLDACYFVGPVAAVEPVAREQLSSVHAAVACVCFSKLGSLVGGTEATATLDRCARLVRGVPMYAASIPRDLGRLDEVATTVAAWHRERRLPNAPRAG